jgi:hypothetical protein
MEELHIFYISVELAPIPPPPTLPKQLPSMPTILSLVFLLSV